GEDTAIGMAMEQSASTLEITGFVTQDMLEHSTIRVKSFEALPESLHQSGVGNFHLETEVYGAGSNRTQNSFLIELAVPVWLINRKPAQLLNVLVGELPRLGFLTGFQLAGVELPDSFGPGPAFGSQGILGLLDKTQGPVLCRAMRPGVGLDMETMAALNYEALVGGFHLVKDDELIEFSDTAAFRNHLVQMLNARDEAMQVTGEKKLYIANLFCEPGELNERWECALELGADAVLVAPFIQGMGVVPYLARQAEVPILAHNSFVDLLTRNTAWGIDDEVICHWLRHLGGDWFVTPGTFAAANMDLEKCRSLMTIATRAEGEIKPMMPNLQGGKHPEGLASYINAVGDRDFMLIVANWIDSHPDGLQQGARIFREALDSF
ncbi:MAG: hypothetical protein KJN90_07495, partial [Gammaproteobacteria bacterium]|nr:hypothetical protein [Gammaproteobacteria bacterium]